jgi:hypothetical protein
MNSPKRVPLTPPADCAEHRAALSSRYIQLAEIAFSPDGAASDDNREAALADLFHEFDPR